MRHVQLMIWPNTSQAPAVCALGTPADATQAKPRESHADPSTAYIFCAPPALVKGLCRFINNTQCKQEQRGSLDFGDYHIVGVETVPGD